MKWRWCHCLVIFLVLSNLSGVEPVRGDEAAAFPLDAKRIVFLGDSITHAGHYITLIEAQLRLGDLDGRPELINLGLPSETCSGLSEPEHPFPRPNVHERLQRALDKTKPDVVVACYGMNDGIYYPFSEDRFKQYQNGINQLIDRVHQSGAKLILMTPPAFDPVPLRGRGKLLPEGSEQYSWKQIYNDYDEVMRRYALWIMQQRDRVEMVIDLHTPVNEFLAERRKTDPEFTMSPDGVHLNQQGHGILAETILRHWGWKEMLPVDPTLVSLVGQQQKIMHDAWLSEVGHQRPGMKPGLPLQEARQKAATLEPHIEALVERVRGQHSTK